MIIFSNKKLFLFYNNKIVRKLLETCCWVCDHFVGNE